MNDVYEIDTLGGGADGGLARVATVIDRLKRHGPVIATMGGDFLSPSAAGLAVVDGAPLDGRQMVDVLNVAGLQWATLGNHEFDIGEAGFKARMAEARFKAVVSNATDPSGGQLPGTVANAIVPVRMAGRTIRIGLVGAMIDSSKRPWVRYLPEIDAVRTQVAVLKGHVDAIVALTHLALLHDRALAEAVPDIDLILGGHEHENVIALRGRRFAPIVKADSNARTVGVVTMTFGRPGERPTMTERMQVIDRSIPKKPLVEARVRYWMARAYDALITSGFVPERRITTLPIPLDGRSSVLRSGSSLLADITLGGLHREAGVVDVALLDVGTLRIDDVVEPGPLTEYDVIRMLPYTDAVLKMSMDGALLAEVLDVGSNNGAGGSTGGPAGNGGFLQVLGAERTAAGWTIAGRPIDPVARYSVAMPDFLLSGNEAGFGFLVANNPQVHDVQQLRDMRYGFIEELKARYGTTPPR